ncbi:DUF2188 domain-containing protein [Agromyces sp. CFH 90414]|uniref:DUF2188 domain-containing protein n=1 Tax=Agromyces agglutinans TaxID=2662258 RepID=A0A6I2F6I3_9MICO|nr:DUF2188 domain-containing protein [Agromyces agglutinans]MRG60219.1 DUF2188 domain-containing protein [Agromyces agglutinans]
MADGDVETRSNRGQWENRVEGHPELSQSFASRDEAVDAGRLYAEEHGAAHTVVDSDPTGAITDEDPASGEPASGDFG